jgi:hypothetical protein
MIVFAALVPVMAMAIAVIGVAAAVVAVFRVMAAAIAFLGVAAALMVAVIHGVGPHGVARAARALAATMRIGTARRSDANERGHGHRQQTAHRVGTNRFAKGLGHRLPPILPIQDWGKFTILRFF